MCTTDRHDGSCPACETDTWIVPSGLTSPDSARPATETRRTATQAPTDPPPRERASVSLPALTVAAFEAAMRRDGGTR